MTLLMLRLMMMIIMLMMMMTYSLFVRYISIIESDNGTDNLRATAAAYRV